MVSLIQCIPYGSLIKCILYGSLIDAIVSATDISNKFGEHFILVSLTELC